MEKFRDILAVALELACSKNPNKTTFDLDDLSGALSDISLVKYGRFVNVDNNLLYLLLSERPDVSLVSTSMDRPRYMVINKEGCVIMSPEEIYKLLDNAERTIGCAKTLLIEEHSYAQLERFSLAKNLIELCIKTLRQIPTE